MRTCPSLVTQDVYTVSLHPISRCIHSKIIARRTVVSWPHPFSFFEGLLDTHLNMIFFSHPLGRALEGTPTRNSKVRATARGEG